MLCYIAIYPKKDRVYDELHNIILERPSINQLLHHDEKGETNAPTLDGAELCCSFKGHISFNKKIGFPV